MKYQKGSDLPIFSTLEERTEEAPWGDTWKILILGQEQCLEAGEDILTPTESPYKLPINLEEAEKYVIVANLMREDMTNMWSKEDLLGKYGG